MKIKALIPFLNGTLSMEQYQVAEVTDTLGNQLIAAGVAIEIGGGGSGGGGLIVTGTLDESTGTVTLDKTWQEIKEVGCGNILVDSGTNIQSLSIHQIIEPIDTGGLSGIYVINAIMFRDEGDGLAPFQMSFTTNSATGYPSITLGGD